MAEGVFPKVGGDIAYASEANRFAGAGRFLKIGSSTWVTSGTAYQDVGSILVGAGSLTNPCYLNISFRTGTAGANTTIGLKYLASGTALLGSQYIGIVNADFDVSAPAGMISIVAGSPLKGHCNAYYGPKTSSSATDGDRQAVDDIDLSQEHVIFTQIRTEASQSGGVYSEAIQAFRGSL